MAQIIHEVLAEHDINGYPLYKDGQWTVYFEDCKSQFVYELKGGDAHFLPLISRRYLLTTHRLWTESGTINGTRTDFTD